MSSEIDSDESGFVIGTVLSIRIEGIMIGAGGPSKGRQVDVSIDASGMDQQLQQCVVRLQMRNIKGLISYVRCREFNPGRQRENSEARGRCRCWARDSWADQIVGKGVYMVENGIT